MRILHTADWHLGKMFYGEYLTEEQARVLTKQLLPLIKEERIEALIIAGDIYDRSLPPVGAVALFDEILTKIAVEAHVPCFIISGNHDSATRLSFGNALMEKEGIFIGGELATLHSPIVLEDRYGAVAFYLLPFAEPAVVRQYYNEETVKDHETALRCLRSAQKIVPDTRSVCVAHAFVTGGVPCDSERPLAIGGSECVDVSCFDGFSYTALGHLHGPQKAGGRDNVRYAGSLLKYSFGEAKQKKGVSIVEIDAKGHAAWEQIPLVPQHDVRIIQGRFADIMTRPEENTEDFLLVRLEDEEPILDGLAKLRKKYPHVLALETPNRMIQGAPERKFDVRHTNERELFLNFTMAMRDGRTLSEHEKEWTETLWRRLWQEGGDGLL